MIHSKTELKFINDLVGYGVFATEKIPEGTIVYVKDSLEITVSPGEYEKHNAKIKEVIEKYSYIDPKGDRIVSWDFAKFVNHCCNSNTISTGYGFEIATRDILPGEEITDEYGLFNLEEEMNLTCSFKNCRGKIKLDDFETYFKDWDAKIKKSLFKFNEVDQPLFDFLEEDVKLELDEFFANEKSYKSVYSLKFKA